MGDPKKPRKNYETPRKVWDSERLQKDRKLKATYGLRNMREIWKAETFLRTKRQNARKMLALPIEEREKRERQLIESLMRLGLLRGKASLDDILGLKVEALLERRLQTIVFRKNLALTPKQSRQFIVHGKIAVKGRKLTVPGYLVPQELESTVAYFKEPMKLNIPEKPAKKQKELSKEFEEAKPLEEIEKGDKAEEPEEKKIEETKEEGEG